MGSDQANMESESNPRSNSTSHLPDHSNDEHTHVPADSLPDPVPGPTKDSSSNSWPVLPHIKARRSQRQFFISPFPLKLNAKVAKNALNKEKTPSSDVVVFSVAEITKQATGSTTRSDATEAELDHDLRIEDRRRRQEFPRRLLTAAVGGIFVIVPMVVMSIGRTMTKCLITSTVAILLFGITLAWCSTSDEASVFIATAGYAAFLAVFVAVGND